MSQFNSFWKSRKNLSTLLAVLIIGLLIAVGIFYVVKSKSTSLPKPVASGNEIMLIKATTNLDQRVKLYKQLIVRVGPIHAQEDLYQSGLPFDGQTHLLNHTVGDYLYNQFGPAGLVQCKEYFLASCYHGFILDAISLGGNSEVDKILALCNSQGGPVLSQCSHAMGHGFLAFVDYKNLTQALTMCDDTAARVTYMPVFNCYDGVFMENIWGLHSGVPSKDRWVKSSDHSYPCDDARINPKYLLGCWSNQPSLAYQQLGGNISAVSDICLQVKDKSNQQMCFNGLSRQIHPLTNGSADKTFAMCGQLAKSWIDYCVNTVAQAAFSVGDRILPFTICKRQVASAKDDCYQIVTSMAHSYSKSPSDTQAWCAEIPEEPYRTQCLGIQAR